MEYHGAIVGSSRSAAEGRPSDDTLVGRSEAGPLPKKRGEIGWVQPQERADAQQDPPTPGDQFPARHPADRSAPIPPSSAAATALATSHPNTSTSSLQSRSSALKQFLRTPRPLPTIHGVRSATVLRVVLMTFTIVGSILGWIIAVTRMNRWDERESAFANSPLPSTDPSGNSTAIASMPSNALNQMTNSSLVFVHVAFGAAILFQLLMLERAVYRFRAERYAFLHPQEMTTAAAVSGSSVMGLAPWNRPPLPTYAAALGVRGTGDIEDDAIAVPPPPEYGNTRGSTLLLASQLPFNLRPARTRPTSQHTMRDALGRPTEAWSRPVSYGEDQMRENARRSLDLETALARLSGPSSSSEVTRPRVAVVRK